MSDSMGINNNEKENDGVVNFMQAVFANVKEINKEENNGAGAEGSADGTNTTAKKEQQGVALLVGNLPYNHIEINKYMEMFKGKDENGEELPDSEKQYIEKPVHNMRTRENVKNTANRDGHEQGE